MGARFNIPVFQPNDLVGRSIPGAQLWTFVGPSTTTPKPVFSDRAATTPLANPLVADAGGYFPTFFIDGSYRMILTDADATDPLAVGSAIWDVSDITSSDVTNAAQTNVANTFTQLNTFEDVGIEIIDTVADPDFVTVKGDNTGLNVNIDSASPGTYGFSVTDTDTATKILEVTDDFVAISRTLAINGVDFTATSSSNFSITFPAANGSYSFSDGSTFMKCNSNEYLSATSTKTVFSFNAGLSLLNTETGVSIDSAKADAMGIWQFDLGVRLSIYVNKAAINTAFSSAGRTAATGDLSYITGTGPVYWSGADWLKVSDNTSAP